MKRTKNKKNSWWLCRMVFLLIALCVGSCGDKNDDESSDDVVFNPSNPVRVDAINPTMGGLGQRLVITGDNFGNDVSKVSVFVGGQKAVVISVKHNAIYCLVPAKAYTGEIDVWVSDGETQVTTRADMKFDYQRKTVVSTLLGTRRDDGSYDSKDGPFGDCGALGAPNWLAFDPKYHHLIYIAQDAAGGDENEGGGNMRVIDLQNQYLGTALNDGDIHGNRRGRSLDFFNEDCMAVAVDQGDDLRAAVYGFRRIKDAPVAGNVDYRMWGSKVTLVNYKQCNTVAFHPVDHDMYFNSYEKGQFYRVDHTQIQAIFDGTRTEPAEKEELFQHDNGWEYNIRMHPTGNYAYIVSINQHYIMRTNYNWTTHRFTTPYVVAGQSRTSGYEDAIGSKARFNTPYQGAFVKNPDYAGQADEYDFIICDKMNQCLRKITPQGKVSTFAGRGSASLNNNPWGYVDGDLRLEARFDRPKGLVYDESTQTFYVGDGSNRRIRKISHEGDN